MTGKVVLCWMALAALGCGACSSPAPTGRSHTLVRQNSVTPAVAFAAAERAVGERFHVRVSDSASGLLRTEPVLSDAPPEPGRIGSKLRPPRRIRKTVEVRVEPAGDGVAIACKVLIEENQTGAHRMFAGEHSLSDVPSDTPADRGAATTKEQMAVWRTTGRDRELEREICRAISELLSQPTD